MQVYKTFIVDMYSQGSTTAMFGYNPDEDIEEHETALLFTLYGEQNTLDYARFPTAT
jgi:chromosome partitioning protein